MRVILCKESSSVPRAVLNALLAAEFHLQGTEWK